MRLLSVLFLCGARVKSEAAQTAYPRCYSDHLDADDSGSLAYYRALSDYLDETEAPHPGLGRLEHVPAGSVPGDGSAPVNGEDGDVYLMRISALLSFLKKRYDEATGEPYLANERGPNRYAISAATLLAAHHFNTGDGSVVEEVRGVDERCPVRIVVDFWDAESNRRGAVDALTSRILTPRGGGRTPTTAILGGLYSSTSIPTSTLSGVYGVPQACPACTSTELDDVNQYPYFGRIIPSDAGTARAIVSFVRQRNAESNDEDIGHLGVLYKDDAFGTAYYLAIKESEYYWVYSKERGGHGDGAAGQPDGTRLEVEGSHFSTHDEVDAAVRALRDTGFRIFVGIFYTSDYERVMESAHRHGIAGPGYQWILTDGFGPDYFNDKSFPAGSPLAVASQGLGVVMAHGGRLTERGDTGFDKIIDAWTRQDEKFVDYANCVGHPRTNSLNSSIYYQAEGGFFRDIDLIPPKLVFFYDTIISFGLGACSLLAEGDAGIVDGKMLVKAFLRQEFMGSSGYISMDSETHSRRPGSAFFVVFNAQGTTDGNATTFSRDIVAHTVPASDSNSIVWVDVPGKTFRYSDNTTDFPRPLPPREGVDENHLSPTVRAVFLFLASAIFSLSFFFSGWTFCHRQERVVSLSQPLFLHMICAGTFLMGWTIVTLSIDDSIASKTACSAACMLNQWFLAIGFVVAFSSLFAKEWRINKIFHNPSMKRMKITPKDVIVPFVALLVMNVFVLSLWTGLSPLTWERFNLGTIDMYGRELKSVGMCTSATEDWAPYASVLLLINTAMVGLASFQAYRARKISVEYSEARWVAIILAVILQAVAIGLPLIALVHDNPTANLVVRAGLVFMLCITFLLVMFVPKIFYLRDARIEAADKEARLKRSAERRTAFLERVEGTRHIDQGDDSGQRSSGLNVLFHPKSHADELTALKVELECVKRELRNSDACLCVGGARLSTEKQHSLTGAEKLPQIDRRQFMQIKNGGYEEFLRFVFSVTSAASVNERRMSEPQSYEEGDHGV